MHRYLTSMILLFVAALPSTATAFPALEDLPEQPTLPDPSTMLDGTKITTPEEWYTFRRPELKRLFQHYVYGFLPESDGVRVHKISTVDDVLDGKATLVQMELRFPGLPRRSPGIHLAVFLPNNAEKPSPLFLAVNKCGNHTVLSDPRIKAFEIEGNERLCKGEIDEQRGSRTEYWCVEYLIDRGYAFATFQVADMDPDKNDFTDGIHPWITNLPNTDPDANWGTIAAWTWGLSRAIDYLVEVPSIASHKIALIGHSRRGKTALFAAAMDDRVALVVPHQSGTGGMALSRDNDQESVKRITTSFPHWFNTHYSKFGDGNETRLPIDQHLLTALVAPRPLLDNGGLQDTWANFPSAHRNLQAASSVYEFLGVPGIVGTGILQDDDVINEETAGRLLQYQRDEKHTLNIDYWRAILDFADSHLK